MVKRNTKIIGRCLSCGRVKLDQYPKDNRCPRCRDQFAPALFPTKTQARLLGQTSWEITEIPIRVNNFIQELGLVATAPSREVMADLKILAKSRTDVSNKTHLHVQRHILNRPGMSNGDLKSKKDLERALSKPERRVVFATQQKDKSAPSVMGKLIEAELSYRSSKRELSILKFKSFKVVYFHPLLSKIIHTEVDIECGDDPGELKTVDCIYSIDEVNLFRMIMQLAGQAIAMDVDEGLLVLAERSKPHRITAVKISSLKEFHNSNIKKWILELEGRNGGFV